MEVIHHPYMRGMRLGSPKGKRARHACYKGIQDDLRGLLPKEPWRPRHLSTPAPQPDPSAHTNRSGEAPQLPSFTQNLRHHKLPTPPKNHDSERNKGGSLKHAWHGRVAGMGVLLNVTKD